MDIAISLGSVILGVMLTIGIQSISMWFQSKENMRLRELDDLSKLYDKLEGLLKTGESSIPCFNIDEAKKYVNEYYLGKNDDEIKDICLKISNECPNVLSFYLQNRHIMTKNVREEGDKVYKNFIMLLTSDVNTDNLTPENRKIFVISYYTLSGLMVLGILEIIEIVSDKLYSFASNR